MTDVTLPTPEINSGTADWSDVFSNDKALREVVNGELDNSNLSGTAGITDANLASPNNSAYRLVAASQQPIRTLKAAGTYFLGNLFEPLASGGEVIATSEYRANPPYFYFDDADFAVAGKTLKMRLRAQAAVNATKPTIKFTFGLYPVTVAGGAGVLTVTLGTVVSGSTVEINEPAASTVSQANSGDFTVPVDGAYALGVVTSNTMTVNSAVLMSAQLQIRSA